MKDRQHRRSNNTPAGMPAVPGLRNVNSSPERWREGQLLPDRNGMFVRQFASHSAPGVCIWPRVAQGFEAFKDDAWFSSVNALNPWGSSGRWNDCAIGFGSSSLRAGWVSVRVQRGGRVSRSTRHHEWVAFLTTADHRGKHGFQAGSIDMLGAGPGLFRTLTANARESSCSGPALRGRAFADRLGREFVGVH